MLKKILSIFILAFLFSCGIDDIVYLEPPKAVHSPTGTLGPSQLYFEFKTTDVKNNANALGYFKGFDVFYRIYEREADCTADIGKAIEYNKNNPANSANYLTNTLNYKFLTYGSNNPSSRPLVSRAALDRNIEFRLIKRDTFQPDFKISGILKGTVKRFNGKEFKHSEISENDSDLKSDSTGGVAAEVFVAVFVATYGTDQYFKQIYSEIVSLGYTKIP